MAEHEIRGTGFRVGLVTAQDTVNCRVKVQFPDRDQIVSAWLPILVTKSQNDKFYHIPDVGEQVACLMDLRDEDGVVLGAIYSEADTPPVNSADKLHVTFKDSAVIEYDRNLHVLKHVAQDDALIKYDAVAHALTIQLPNGAVMNITANGATIGIDADGNVLIKPTNGDVQFETDDFTTSLNQIISTFNEHVHSDAGGSGDSGTPTTLIP